MRRSQPETLRASTSTRRSNASPSQRATRTAPTARDQMAAFQWQASKMAPTRYGYTIDLNVDHTFDVAAMLDKGHQRVLNANQPLGRSEPDGDAQ